MFTLPNLPYDYVALEPYIDEETMRLHHDKHHGAYVKNLNEILAGQEELLKMEVEELLQNLDKVPADLKQNVINNGGQHYNHSLFWEIMSPEYDQKPEGEILTAINKDFGSVEKFQEEFEKKALGRFGSGWIWLVVKNGKLEIMDTVNGDSPVILGLTPVLGLDIWEHAYYLKYRNMRIDYVKAWWRVVNWKRVGELYKEVKG